MELVRRIPKRWDWTDFLIPFTSCLLHLPNRRQHWILKNISPIQKQEDTSNHDLQIEQQNVVMTSVQVYLFTHLFVMSLKFIIA